MIKIDNLTKIYKSKKRNKVKALDNITLTLPNNGLVFVLGKSGSGKSTLLNLIGGLDSITEGKITVDGNDISNFKEKEFCDYRNTHIGFIFQDYHLIDELTVYDNIVLSLNLRRIEDKDLVTNALKKVDLEGYENRYPTELSGGERQRVAIARAIVKNPRIILADEPTGNLDTNTATSIVELLKELSKECLILIVSHNRNDAYKYGDRIIELSKGKIISDKSKNPNYNDNVVFLDNIIYYPCDKVLDDNDVNIINSNMSKENKLVVVNDKYIETKETNIKSDKVKIEKKSLSIIKELLLSLKFLKNKIFSIFLSSFMVSAIMVILALALTIVEFDAGEVLENEMDKMNQEALSIDKFISEEEQEVAEKKFYDNVTEDDINTFKNAGYNGDIYEVLNYSLSISYSGNFAGWDNPYFKDSYFIEETLGTLIVDEEFLINKFGTLEYVAKQDEFNPCGIIITDYVADAIIINNANYTNKTYDELLGSYYYSKARLNRGYINGIIKTDYKEKYQSLLERYKLVDDFSEIYQDKEFIKFSDEIFSSLGYCYTLNANFKEEIKNDYSYESIWHYNLSFNNHPFLSVSSCYIRSDVNDNYELGPNDVVMNMSKYNELFGTEYTSSNLNTFVPHKVILCQYMYSDMKCENPLFSKEITIKALSNGIKYTMAVGEELLQDFRNNLIYTKGLYFDGNENIDKVIEVADELNYEQNSLMIDGIHTMTKAVDVFIPIFELIAIVLCGGIIFILVNFSTKMIKDKMHDIGILKALGAQNKSVRIVFGIQILLIAIVTILMSTVGYYFFIDLANDVLIDSLRELAPSHIVLDLDFLTFKFVVVGFNVILIILLSIISLVVPMIKIKNIKPVKIIKAKE